MTLLDDMFKILFKEMKPQLPENRDQARLVQPQRGALQHPEEA